MTSGHIIIRKHVYEQWPNAKAERNAVVLLSIPRSTTLLPSMTDHDHCQQRVNGFVFSPSARPGFPYKL